ncbi:DUF397 domain-containing protein [Streptomyces triculaminicus]|uniref:DUF397 domain-containing protein n=1 Tax=Streptomyces triculaminicus TaxID=2816232 RepID=UPI0037D8CB08
MPAMPRYVPSRSAHHPVRCRHRAPHAGAWHRSSHSTGMNNCVETAVLAPELLAVRDSKRTPGPVLLFSPRAWSAFTTDLRRGRPGGALSGSAGLTLGG